MFEQRPPENGTLKSSAAASASANPSLYMITTSPHTESCLQHVGGKAAVIAVPIIKYSPV